MWFSSPSVESITRPRLTVIAVSAVAAASACYCLWQSTLPPRPESVTGPGLHRSNAVRRSRRSHRRSASSSTSASEVAGDENFDVNDVGPPLGDAETEGPMDDEWWEEPGNLPAARAGHNIVNLLFRVSEDNARRNGLVHRGCLCNSCGMVPIRGYRYRCANCADFDLCETCESQGVHTKTHVFYKIKVPAPPFGPRQMQPVWYTGDPETCRVNLPKELIGKLSMETGFERPELEAFWEQWTYMAGSEWREDPDGLNLAMDRKTFERCLVPTGGSRHATPNLIHDRMFAFYDSNKDGYIGFSEFLHGLSYRKGGNKLQKIFDGYDLDGDGYVSRKDFLRMFRAYYVLYKQMHKDILDGLEDQLLASTEAQQLVASRQPLSSLFGREGPVPRGDRMPRLDGKTLHRDGSIDIAEGTATVAENTGDTSTRQDILTSLFACAGGTNVGWGDFSRRIREPRVADADRPYLITLIDPPQNLEELPRAVMGNHTLEIDENDDDEEAEDTSEEEEEEEELPDIPRPTGPEGAFHPTETDKRIEALAYHRNRKPRLEKRRRDMARAQVHERWLRRQFYLDEEEGGTAPEDWEDNEDIFMNGYHGEDASSDGQSSPEKSPTKKPLFGQLLKEFDKAKEFRESPDPERDAGKEILYQVTQQAFNELLDTIFKPAEDIAVEARTTKEARDKHREAIDNYTPMAEKSDDDEQPDGEVRRPEEPTPDNKPASDKTLGELLSESGYCVVEEDAQPRNAVDLDNITDPELPELESASETTSVEDSELDFDPTMPQFRPNRLPEAEVYRSTDAQYYPAVTIFASPAPSEADSEDAEPSLADLKKWKELEKAEQEAIERGGWGKLSYDEFESIFRSQEYRGNRLDYLGSWIDFCIP